ncbi:hypothetical protein [Haloactinospora alba]|nr:hypothetical protein [Haloactinospora alba]
MRTVAVAAALAVAVTPFTPVAAAAATGGQQSPEEDPSGGERAFTLQDPRIRESSGLARSERHDGVYWTHNDSGDYGPDIYAVDSAGETVATVTLTGGGVEARDWEAIATGTGNDGEPALYIGDIGDNAGGEWPGIRVYRIPEPRDLTDRTVEATTFTLTYADGARNAEAMMIDPRDNRLYLVSKELAGTLYAAPAELDPAGTNTLEPVGSAPLYATDAAFAPDGSQYAVRTYRGVTLYDAEGGVPGESTADMTLPSMEQGESLTYGGGGKALLAGSEGDNSPVWRVPLLEPETPSPEAGEGSETTDSADSGSTEGQGWSASSLIWVGVGVTALVIAGIVLLARRG